MRRKFKPGCYSPLVLILSLVLSLGLASATIAQEDIALPAYAFKNVTIHKADGDVIKKGTIVWRDGVITNMGKKSDIPFDAMVWDGGDSLHVYPGFIDGMSLWGSPDQPKKREEADEAGNPPLGRSGVQPERKPHEIIEKSEDFEAAQKHGFTTAALGLKGEMLPGQIDLFMLNGNKTSDYLASERIGMLSQFSSAARSPGPVYPTSVMGIMAHFRQVWFDATALRDHMSYYNNHPEGMEPPKRSQPLEAMIPVINQDLPLYFVLESSINTQRVLNMQEQLGFDMVMVSAKEGYKNTEVIKKNNIPVLASFDLPDKPAWKEDEDEEDGDEEKDKKEKDKKKKKAEEHEELTEDEEAHRERQWEAYQKKVNNIKAMMEEGINPGFASDGLKLKELQKNMKTMQDNGLTEQQLLKILTINTAEILGIQNVTGELEEGNLASFSVFTKPFTEKKAKVKYSVSGGNLTEFNLKSN